MEEKRKVVLFEQFNNTLKDKKCTPRDIPLYVDIRGPFNTEMYVKWLRSINEL